MENSGLGPIGTVMAKDCLIISTNDHWTAKIGQVLRDEYGCHVRVASTTAAAKESVAGCAQPLTVFQDLGSLSAPLKEPLRVCFGGPPAHLQFIAFGKPGGSGEPNAQLPPLDLLRFRQTLASLGDGQENGKKPSVVRFGEFDYATTSAELFATLQNLRRVAAHDVSILLVGETGTGKTTLARLVHNLSLRSDQPLLTVACGALPGELIESELFGHVRGSFTGAEQSKIGKFEAAGNGSLLLDEIDVLGLHQQARLLRVIETGEFEPVGSNETRLSKARLIAATNVDLNELMDRNEFRSDLYYRLNVLEFRIPPLRDRRLDIVPLTLGFVQEFCASHKVIVNRIDPEFLSCVQAYSWPGNVRELKNHIRRAVLFCEDKVLTVRDLNPTIQASFNVSNAAQQQPDTLSEMVACSEQELIERALRDHKFKRAATAEALGISRVGLYKKMRKYGMLELKASRRTAQQKEEESAVSSQRN